eukprot:CAMPEP_0115828406 /NCGR_PEP_ID=MMETSP0287-20121206/557_1 /TAXON_ID=412157 /ORGANISM="Chrysochromulina rotalis, Strain UIO044" /LENGTH=179 /DNA_ID=CAMNT_0003281621 /DNA_START=172 /DNA_END=711 /DNA_ORIENTATION=-
MRRARRIDEHFLDRLIAAWGARLEPLINVVDVLYKALATHDCHRLEFPLRELSDELANDHGRVQERRRRRVAMRRRVGHLRVVCIHHHAIQALDAFIHAVHQGEDQELTSLEWHDGGACFYTALAQRSHRVRRGAEADRTVHELGAFPVDPAGVQQRVRFRWIPRLLASACVHIDRASE